MSRVKRRDWNTLSKKDKVLSAILHGFIIFLSIQLIVSGFQVMRYTKDEYCCLQMTRDCEGFFETLGFRTYTVSGCNYEETNNSYFTWHNKTYAGIFDSGHIWCVVDFFGLHIPFESTALFPINPLWRSDYDEVQVSEGFFEGGEWRNLNEHDFDWRDLK